MQGISWHGDHTISSVSLSWSFLCDSLHNYLLIFEGPHGNSSGAPLECTDKFMWWTPNFELTHVGLEHSVALICTIFLCHFPNCWTTSQASLPDQSNNISNLRTHMQNIRPHPTQWNSNIAINCHTFSSGMMLSPNHVRWTISSHQKNW